MRKIRIFDYNNNNNDNNNDNDYNNNDDNVDNNNDNYENDDDIIIVLYIMAVDHQLNIIGPGDIYQIDLQS